MEEPSGVIWGSVSRAPRNAARARERPADLPIIGRLALPSWAITTQHDEIISVSLLPIPCPGTYFSMTMSQHVAGTQSWRKDVVKERVLVHHGLWHKTLAHASRMSDEHLWTTDSSAQWLWECNKIAGDFGQPNDWNSNCLLSLLFAFELNYLDRSQTEISFKEI